MQANTLTHSCMTWISEIPYINSTASFLYRTWLNTFVHRPIIMVGIMEISSNFRQKISRNLFRTFLTSIHLSNNSAINCILLACLRLRIASLSCNVSANSTVWLVRHNRFIGLFSMILKRCSKFKRKLHMAISQLYPIFVQNSWEY